MRILIYGAGALGSLYATRLLESGQQVTILARDQRFHELQEKGIFIQNVLTGQSASARVPLVEKLDPEDRYELAVVVMGKHQVGAVLPILSANKHIPNVLFLHNNAAGPQAMVRTLGIERVLLGFAGVGGKRDGHSIKYLLIPQQPTTLGEIDGRITPRLKQISQVFQNAGFPIAKSRQIDDALKTHAILITCIESAILMAGGNRELAAREDLLKLMVNAIREGFKGLQSQGIPIVPFKLKAMFLGMPKVFPLRYWQNSLRSPLGEVSLSAHANSARGEVQQLIDEVRSLLPSTSVATPAMDQLFSWAT